MWEPVVCAHLVVGRVRVVVVGARGERFLVVRGFCVCRVYGSAWVGDV